MAKILEQNLCKIFISEIEKFYPGCEIFYEVKRTHSKKVDVVIKTKSLIVCCELKTSFNLSVIEQAVRNIPYCNESAVVVPKISNRYKDIAIKICNKLGLTIFIVDTKANNKVELFNKGFVETKPKINLKLFEGQKTYVIGGEASGKCYSEFSKTIDNIIEYINDIGPANLKTIIKNVKHHYSSNSSAISALNKIITRGDVKTLRISNNIVYVNNK